MARVLVTGGMGYVGSVLVPKLYDAGHDVEIVDLCWFGVRLGYPLHRMDFTEVPLEGFDAIIHLAGIANDPTGELDPKLTWETNVLGTAILAQRAVEAGVKQFIYASSGSVYGISDAPEVTEESPLVPISEYNKTKMVAERCLLSYSDKMDVQIIRPATVCGYSPRMRLDVMVNSFAIQALTRGVISYDGGGQYRPNIHIDDMTDLYVWMLERPQTGIWNAGFENLRINEIARMVADITGAKIAPRALNDPRSYRINSDKLLEAGFKPKKNVLKAIEELITMFHCGHIKDTDECYNIRMMTKPDRKAA